MLLPSLGQAVPLRSLRLCVRINLVKTDVEFSMVAVHSSKTEIMAITLIANLKCDAHDGSVFGQAVEDGREVDIEYRVVLPDGSERWVHSRGRMQPSSTTNPARLLGVSVDVTERKRSWEELQRSYEEVKKLLDLREAARAAKDWDESDRLRDEIDAAGWTVRDSADGQVLKKK